MTPTEYADMVGFLESRWGNLHRGWESSGPGALWADFQVYPGKLAMEAVRDLFYDGSSSCPSPSKVVSVLRAKMAARGATIAEYDPNWCDGNHTWGFETTETGERDAMCVRCGETRTFAAGDLRTVGELQDDPKPPQPRYDTTDVPY